MDYREFGALRDALGNAGPRDKVAVPAEILRRLLVEIEGGCLFDEDAVWRQEREDEARDNGYEEGYRVGYAEAEADAGV